MAGETVSVAASAARQFYDNPGAGLFAATYSLTFSASNNELNDVMEAGYLGPNVKPVAVIWVPSDMDTNGTPTVVHKVTVGSTDVATGLTGAQSGTAQIVPCSSLTTTSDVTLVKVTTTTAAATAQAGTATLILLCQKA